MVLCRNQQCAQIGLAPNQIGDAVTIEHRNKGPRCFCKNGRHAAGGRDRTLGTFEQTAQAFGMPQESAQVDIFGRLVQPNTAVPAAHGFDKTSICKILNDLHEMILGYSKSLGNFADRA